MKHKARHAFTMIALVNVMLFCLSSTAYAQAEIAVQPLANDSEIETINGSASDEIASLTSLIVMYSEQLEEYDRSNGIFVTTCISFAGVVLGLVVALLTTQKKKVEGPNVALSSLFAILPAIITLCLYVFSIQCKRVAYFRGYLAYLEERLSNLIETPIVFNSGIVPTYLEQFPTNKYGPIAMIIGIVILFGASAALCIRYAKPNKVGQKTSFGEKWGLTFLFRIILLVCIVFCVVFVRDLCTNMDARKEAYNYCINIAK